MSGGTTYSSDGRFYHFSSDLTQLRTPCELNHWNRERNELVGQNANTLKQFNSSFTYSTSLSWLACSQRVCFQVSQLKPLTTWQNHQNVPLMSRLIGYYSLLPTGLVPLHVLGSRSGQLHTCRTAADDSLLKVPENKNCHKCLTIQNFSTKGEIGNYKLCEPWHHVLSHRFVSWRI